MDGEGVPDFAAGRGKVSHLIALLLDFLTL